MHIVLVEPEIPPNTGNIARLCAATGSTLHLIEPLGFRLNDATLKRAGMDYWKEVAWFRWPSFGAFETGFLPENYPWSVWFIESGGPRGYHEVRFRSHDVLVFGRESSGLPSRWLEARRDHWLRIPMSNPNARSLNLSNCVALVLFEALRQNGFPE